MTTRSTPGFEPAALLHPGQSMPGFALPETDGTIVRLKAFKQRRPVLLALLHSARCPDCRQWLSTLAASRDDLAYLDVLPLLIFPDDLATLRAFRSELALPGKLLSDPDHATLSRFARITAPTPHLPVMLVAVDRYTTCLETWLGDEPAQWPPLTEPLRTFAFAEQEDCACGLPIWPEG